MKQKKRRLVIALICTITMFVANAQTIVTVDGLQYSLSGAYASVYGVDSGNTNETIEVPASIIYEGLKYEINSVGGQAFFRTSAKYVKRVILPNTIKTILTQAFANPNIVEVKLSDGLNSISTYAFEGSSITEIIIPKTVTLLKVSSGVSIFKGCNLLRSIVYLGETPPTNWVATSQTYVPNTSNYSNPTHSINSAQIIPMVSWGETAFGYSGNPPSISWTNNIDGYNASFTEPVLKTDVGVYSEIIPVTFTNGEESFTADIPYQYTINPAILTAKVDDANRTYGDANPDFNITYSGFVNGEDVSAINTKPTAFSTATTKSAVGTYPITLSGGKAGNYSFEYEQGTLTVTKAPLSIQVNDANRIYGGINPKFSLSYTGLKNNESVPEWTSSPIFTTSASNVSDAGTYPVNVECEPKNYTIINNVPGTLSVTKATLAITAKDATMNYGDILPTFEYTYKGFVNGDNESVLSKLPFITTTATSASNVDAYKITPGGAEAKNYDFTYTAGTLSISRRLLTVKALSTSRLYGENNPVFTLEYDGFVNNETASVLDVVPKASSDAVAMDDVGMYPINVSGGKAQNYKFNYEQGTLTVTKAPLSIKVKDVQRVYGKNNPAFMISYDGLKNSESEPEWEVLPTFITTATNESEAGFYPVNVNCEPKNYYLESNTSGTLTITKAPLTINVKNATINYGDALPLYEFTYSGFVNGDDVSALSTLPSIETTATATSNAGTYTITPYGAVAKNYDFTYTAGSLNIKQRPLTVKALSASRLYGENNPAFILEYDGFVNNETKSVLEVEPTVSTKANVQSGVGTYEISVSGGKATNYYMTYQSGQLSITPRDLKASVGNYERPYGDDNPKFTLLYEGLAGNDTENSLSTKPVVRTNATKTSDVGTYDLEVTGGYSPNYTLSYGSGKLTIVKAEQIFEWNQDLSNLEVGSQIELLATASSGLPVTYIMEDNDFAEIYKAGSKTYMECKAVGSFSIKAVQEGGDNYYSTQRINKKVTIVGEGEYNPTLIVKQSEGGAVSTKVPKGSTHTFTIYEESGWKIHSVTFNDVDVTEQLDEDNRFTTPAITESSSLRVVYESTGENAINTAKTSNVKVQATDFGARVLNANIGDVVQVYSLDGRMLTSKVMTDVQTDVELPDNQTYIIKIADLSVKIMH